ncbi:MAG: 3-oxoacyl-[acyl-carrier-protein] synthase III C-terminal domain-containing protein [Candidatus Binatia bacterium]
MLYLHGAGHFHPHNEITNAFLAALDIGTTDDWIVERTGIHSRRTVLDLDYIRETRNRDVRAAGEATTHTNAELGARAAEMAIERAGIDREEIGMVLAGGSLPDRAAPAEACAIAAELGLSVPAIDVRSACTSFLAALDLLSRMRVEALAPYVLVVTPETITRSVDYNDRNAAVLWGDGAAAAVVSNRCPAPAVITHTLIESNPGGYDKVEIPWAGHFTQEGRTVQTFAIKKSARVLRTIGVPAAGDANGAGAGRHFIGHQANLLMLESVCRMCDVDDALHHHNVERLGNTGAAGAPSVLSECWDTFSDAASGAAGAGVAEGTEVAMIGVGAGLTWAGAVVHFGARAAARIHASGGSNR